MSAIPTVRVPATLHYRNGAVVKFDSVEFFSRRNLMIWVRGQRVLEEGLMAAVVDGIQLDIASVEKISEDVCEIRFDRINHR